MNTSELHKKIMLDYGARPDVRLWRNNVGQLRDRNDNVIRYGVCNPGGSDLIGIKTIVVQPENVGQRLGVFVAIEAKMGSGRATKDQVNFLRVVGEMGGFAGVARETLDAAAILFPWGLR